MPTLSSGLRGALSLGMLGLLLLAGCDTKDPTLTRTYTLAYTASITGDATVDNVMLHYTDASGVVQTVAPPTLPFSQSFTVNHLGSYSISLTGRYRGGGDPPLAATLSVTATLDRIGAARQTDGQSLQYRQTTDTDAAASATVTVE